MIANKAYIISPVDIDVKYIDLLYSVAIELERNRRVVILNAWQRKPMRKMEIKNQPSCGDQILKYNILLIVTLLLLIISKK